MSHAIRKWLTRVATAAALTTVVGGCGHGSNGNSATTDEDAVRRVVVDLQAASRAGDGVRICDRLFTPKLAQSVETSAPSGSCATEVKRELFSPRTEITIEHLDVLDPANATVTVKEANGTSSLVLLVKQRAEWRIRSVQPVGS